MFTQWSTRTHSANTKHISILNTAHAHYPDSQPAPPSPPKDMVNPLNTTKKKTEARGKGLTPIRRPASPVLCIFHSVDSVAMMLTRKQHGMGAATACEQVRIKYMNNALLDEVFLFFFLFPFNKARSSSFSGLMGGWAWVGITVKGRTDKDQHNGFQHLSFVIFWSSNSFPILHWINDDKERFRFL